jgi:membrane fusion protein, multidrug efflux system
VDDQRSPIYVPPIVLPGRGGDEAGETGAEGVAAPSRRREPVWVPPTRDDGAAGSAAPAAEDAAAAPARPDSSAPGTASDRGGAGRHGHTWRIEPITPAAPALREGGTGLAEVPVVEVPLRPADDPLPPSKAPPARPQVDRLRDRAAPQARVTPPFDLPLPGSRLRWAAALLLALLVVIGAIWLISRGVKQPSTGRFTSAGPMPVGTAKVKQGDMPVTLSALGTVTPLATVTVKTQINGQLTQIAFKEGQTVTKGDFLAQIDPRPYQVALEQAESQLAKDQAALQNAQVDLARYQKLVAQNSIARQTLDTQTYLVAQDRAIIQADQAQIDAQKLNLTYCHIVAPVSGRVGLRQVDAGNYVQTSDPNGIVVITQQQPISVIFTLPEDNLPALLRRLHSGATLPVTAFDRTDTIKLDSGTLATIDNQIDTTTGTVKLRAVFKNVEGILFPNQFVNVRVLEDTLHNADLVPTSAIERGAPGTFVYIVKPDNTVAIQKVELGPSDGVSVAIAKGLDLDQVVVTDGADRLKDGAKVVLASAGKGGGAPATAAPAADGEKAGSAAAAQPGARRGQRRRSAQ